MAILALINDNVDLINHEILKYITNELKTYSSFDTVYYIHQ